MRGSPRSTSRRAAATGAGQEQAALHELAELATGGGHHLGDSRGAVPLALGAQQALEVRAIRLRRASAR